MSYAKYLCSKDNFLFDEHPSVDNYIAEEQDNIE